MAFRGIDLRDLWRKGSGLTLRRLLVLIRALPAESEFWQTYMAAENAALTTADKIREREAFYAAQARGVTE